MWVLLSMPVLQVMGAEKTLAGVSVSSSPDNEVSVKTYPNPTTDVIFLEVTFPQQVNMEVRVYNLLGTVVARFEEYNSTGGKYRIDLSEQPNGIYFAEIRTATERKLERIRLAR